MTETGGSGRAAATAVETADWRRRVFALYARVREESRTDPGAAHRMWVAERDELFRSHPASALPPESRATFAGLPVAPYDPAWRFESELQPSTDAVVMDVETGTDGVVPFERLGTVEIPGGSLDVWRLASYGGGIFLPVKDGLAGRPGGTYGGGRYLFDTIKGADLGLSADGDRVTLTLDFNFAYNPSCAYDPAWACPLAQAGNTVAAEIPVGERYGG
jgi:uncharacterized protein (DUF1684 family)